MHQAIARIVRALIATAVILQPSVAGATFHVSQVCQAQFANADFERVDRYVDTQLKEANIPGAAIAVVGSVTRSGSR
jgi:hypothetical protein